MSGTSKNERSNEGWLKRWSRFAVHHRWFVLLGWVLIVVLAAGLNFTVGEGFANNFVMPGTESQDAFDVLESSFPSQAGDTAVIVFQSEQGINDPAIQQEIESALAEAATLPQVAGVVSPFDNPAQISADGTVAYADIQYSVQGLEVDTASAEALYEVVDATNSASLRVEVGGQVVLATETEPGGAAEAVGFILALFILIVAFGSIIAAGMPLITALFGLAVGIMLVGVSTVFFDIPTFTPILLSMIGIGVGIDYSLFIITRYRENLRHGQQWEDAIASAMDTAGRAVIFAGTVVVIAMTGLVAIQIPLFTAIGVSASIIVAVAIAIAVTMVPALLGFTRDRIDKWSVPYVSKKESSNDDTIGYRLARRIQQHPIVWAIGAATILLLLAAPLLNVNLGFSDAGTGSEDLRSRRTYDLLAEGFGPGFNGTFVIVVQDEAGLDQQVVSKLHDDVQSADGVTAVSPPVPNDDGTVVVMSVIPSTSPQDDATTDTVKSLRNEVIPESLAGTDTVAMVAGASAVVIDINDVIIERMPYFMLIVIGLSMVLLMVVFRSLLIPVKAAIMNLLAIGAALGVVVMVFQWGWGLSLLNVDQTGPIESFMPIMLFAILFGLSMDYEVFLMSRIHENYVHTRDNSYSVQHGLGATSRVIAAAAAIMVTVFLSFAILGGNREASMFGLGLAVAIFVDATLIRMILVPALMELAGEWNWWIPKWLDRIMPTINVEGDEGTSADPETALEPAGD